MKPFNFFNFEFFYFLPHNVFQNNIFVPTAQRMNVEFFDFQNFKTLISGEYLFEIDCTLLMKIFAARFVTVFIVNAKASQLFIAGEHGKSFMAL